MIFLSDYAPITSDECHARFHLNAASPAARNTEQVKITKNLAHGKIWTTNTVRSPCYKSTVITTRLQLAWYEKELNVHEIYIYTIYKYTCELVHVHVYFASTMCRLSFISAV